MRVAAMVTLALAACGGTPISGDDGPQPGTWRVWRDPELGLGGWAFGQGVGRCDPPDYFNPAPETVSVADGSIEWVGVISHRGSVNGRCIDVPAAEERGELRDAYQFCLEVDGETMMPIDDRAIVFLAWNVGRASECHGHAEFDFTGP